MEPLVNGQPGPHESWRELAMASIEHIDLCPTIGRTPERPVTCGVSLAPDAGTGLLSPTQTAEPQFP